MLRSKIKRGGFMSSFNTILTICLVVSAPFTVKADLFIEPSVGYKSETLKLTDKLSTDTKVTMSTPVYGLKIGLRSPVGIDINLAGDYSTGKATFSPTDEKNNFNHKVGAVQLGISALGQMKIYLGYGFLNELSIDEGILNSDMKLKGQAYQAGLQFKISPWFYLSGQYDINQFKTIEGKAYTNGSSVDQYYSKIDSQDFTFALSAIF
jgi:predicted porin